MSGYRRGSAPLDEVIATNPGGFAPEHPEQPPWLQRSDREVQVAQTGDVVVVPLRLAGRVRVQGLDHAIADEIDELPEDHTLQSWGLPAA